MPPFTIGTSIGVGVGVGMFLLLVLLTSVVVLILVVVVTVVRRRKAANKQKRGTPLRDSLWYNNSVVVMQEMEMEKEGVTADNGDGYEDVNYDECEEDGPVEDVFNHYEFDDRKEHIMTKKAPASKDNDQSEDDDDPVEDVFNHYEFDDSTEHIMNRKTPALKDNDQSEDEDDSFEDVFNHYEFDDRMEYNMISKPPASKDNDPSEDDDDSVEDGFNPYKVVDRKEHIKSTNTTAPKESPTSVSATNVTAIYAVVDKSKKKAIREAEEGSTVANEDQYAMLMEKHGKMTDTWEGVVMCGGVEEEQYDDTVDIWNKPQADSRPCQSSEGDYNC